MSDATLASIMLGASPALAVRFVLSLISLLIPSTTSSAHFQWRGESGPALLCGLIYRRIISVTEACDDIIFLQCKFSNPGIDECPD